MLGLSLTCLWLQHAGCQTPINGADALKFSIFSPTDTIEYIKVGKNRSPSKPTILFLQGSQPKPLIFDLGEVHYINLPFNYKKIIDEFNLIVIAMPHTPVVAPQINLNASYNFIPDPNAPKSLSQDYLADNYLDHYVDRTQLVLDDLQAKSWVEKDEIHLIGHSQGAKIAAVVAATYPQIKTVTLLGFNPDGRFEEKIRRLRLELKNGKINPEQYAAKLDGLYGAWKTIIADPKNTSSSFGDPNKTWVSFSIDYLPYLLKINIPISVAYGTEDIIAENCDLLPLEFISAGKNNLKLIPYPGLEHNFFEVTNGLPDYEKPHWDAVLMDVIEWLQNK